MTASLCAIGRALRGAILRPARPDGRDLAIIAGLGALTAAGQAPLGWFWVALPALALATGRIAAVSGSGQAVWLGWLFGAGYFAAAMFWIVEPFLVDIARHGWMAPFALVFMAFGMALFWAAAAGIGHALGGSASARRAVGIALALALAELTRSYVLTGFPWALIGHVWIGTPVAQAAAWVGPVGLTLLTVLVAAMPWAIGSSRRHRLAGAAGSAVLVLLVWGVGALRLAVPEPAAPGPRPLVRLIQPNAAQHLKWIPEMQQEFFERQLQQTASAPMPPQTRRPDLIVWPETSVPWLLNRPGPVLEIIAEAAAGVPVALGIQRTDGMRAYNSLALIGAGGAVGPVYDKHHLVPFGEYIPLGDLLLPLGISAFAAQEGFGYSAGPGPALIDLGPLGHALPLICYEAVFPQDLRAAPTRPDWLLQVTNDAWFGAVSGPYQHLAQARLRAIEQGLPLLRSANTGVTAVIDARGRVLQSVPLNTAGVIDAELPVALPATIYALTGDWPAGLLIFLALGMLGAIRRRNAD